MRIRRIDLLAYGRFSAKTLEFSARQPDIYIILGPNEAGKSTVRTGIRDFLFGIPKFTGYDFVHEAKNLRIGATLEAGRQTLVAMRRKGNKKTLLSDGSDVLSDDSLREFLGSVEPDFFDRMFSLGHEELRRGGQDILDQKDDLAGILFEAGTGLARIKDLAGRVDAEAEEIFSKRASEKRSFYRALDRYKDASERVREAAIRVPDWNSAKLTFEESFDAVNVLSARLLEKRTLRSKLERARRVLPLLAGLSDVEKAMEDLSAYVALPERAEERFDAAVLIRAKSEAARDAALGALEKEKESLATLRVEPELLARAEEIDAVRKLAAQQESTVRDLPRRREELQERMKSIERRCKEIGEPARELAEIDSILIPRPAATALRDLAEDKGRRDEHLRAAGKALAEKIEEIEQLENAHAAIEGRSFNTPAEVLLREAQKRGSFEELIKKARTQLANARRQRSERLRSLVGVSEIDFDLSSVRLPLRPEIEAVRNRILDASELRKVTEAELARLEADMATRDAQRSSLRTEGGAVAKTDLLSARERRNQVWTLIRRGPIGGEIIPSDALAAVAPSGDLPSAFEGLLHSADVLSDRRTDSASESARLAHLEEDLAALKAQSDLGSERARSQIKVLEQLLEEWAALWQGCPVPVPSPETGIQRFDAWAQVLEAEEVVMAAQSDLRDIEEEARTAKAAVAGVLREMGCGDKIAESMTLGELLDVSERILTERGQAEARIESVRKQREEAVKARRKLEREASEAEEGLSQWGASWAKALAAARRPAHESPEVTKGVLVVFDELRIEVEAARDHHANRILKMERDQEGFVAAVMSLSPLIRMDPERIDPQTVAAALVRGLEESRQSARRHEEISKRISTLESEVAKASAAIHDADAEILSIFGSSHPEGGPAKKNLIRIDKKRRELEGDRTDLLRKIIAEGGAPRAELDAETRSLDRNALPAELDQIDSEIADLGGKISEANVKLSAARLAFEQLTRKVGAAEAEEDRMAAVAELKGDADRWIRLRTEARLLLWAIEQYRRKKQNPMLSRAGELFALLTTNSFARLDIEVDDDDQSRIVGIRQEGDVVRVDGMSDGTRDQLFLALRLAAIEDRISAGQRLPFIADDLFVNFDDRRSEAAFRVLADLALQTQVIFFTHHERLAEIARKTVAVDGELVLSL